MFEKTCVISDNCVPFSAGALCALNHDRPPSCLYARRYSADSCGRLFGRRCSKSSNRTPTGQRSFALQSTGRPHGTISAALEQCTGGLYAHSKDAPVHSRTIATCVAVTLQRLRRQINWLHLLTYLQKVNASMDSHIPII